MGCWLLLIEPVHWGSNSILKVRLFRDTLYLTNRFSSSNFDRQTNGETKSRLLGAINWFLLDVDTKGFLLWWRASSSTVDCWWMGNLFRSRDHPRWWYQRSSGISEEKFGILDEMFGISDDMSGISEEMFGSLRFLTRGMSRAWGFVSSRTVR